MASSRQLFPGARCSRDKSPSAEIATGARAKWPARMSALGSGRSCPSRPQLRANRNNFGENRPSAVPAQAPRPNNTTPACECNAAASTGRGATCARTIRDRLRGPRQRLSCHAPQGLYGEFGLDGGRQELEPCAARGGPQRLWPTVALRPLHRKRAGLSERSGACRLHKLEQKAFAHRLARQHSRPSLMHTKHHIGHQLDNLRRARGVESPAFVDRRPSGGGQQC